MKLYLPWLQLAWLFRLSGRGAGQLAKLSLELQHNVTCGYDTYIQWRRNF